MAADQGGGVEPPANISTKKILETIASLLATKDPWGPRGGKASMKIGDLDLGDREWDDLKQR